MGVAMLVKHALAGEPIQRRRVRQWITVASEKGVIILAHEPKDVWALRRR